MKTYAALQERFRSAWTKLPVDVRARLEPQVLAAHQYALKVRDATDLRKNPGLRKAHLRPLPKSPVPHQLLMVYSLLNNDPDSLLKDAANPKSILTHVGADGEVYFGGVYYDATDVGWAYVFLAMAETLADEPDFNTNPASPIPIPNTTTIAIMGDWGGNNTPAQQVATAVQKQNPNYVIHLGDVYYAGTNSGLFLSPYETDNFMAPWPGAAGSSFALNSNHDMYAYATGLFDTTLTSPVFAAQNGCSYFVLTNDNFRIVGLDSAYFAPDDMFMIGSLGNSDNQQQLQFLASQAQAAAAAKQSMIVLTHHNGLATDGSLLDAKKNPLWTQVGNALSTLPNGTPVLWYWGHVHVGAVYVPRPCNKVLVYPRCSGHGCIPWGVATDLQSANVIWGEKEVLGPSSNYFVTNGFTTLALKGASLTETFYDQLGNSQWSATWPGTAKAKAAKAAAKAKAAKPATKVKAARRRKR